MREWLRQNYTTLLLVGWFAWGLLRLALHWRRLSIPDKRKGLWRVAGVVLGWGLWVTGAAIVDAGYTEGWPMWARLYLGVPMFFGFGWHVVSLIGLAFRDPMPTEPGRYER